MTAKILYTTGYLRDGAAKLLGGRGKISKVETFDACVRRLNLLVVDIRFTPYSVAACWRREALAKRLGNARAGYPREMQSNSQGRYLWVPALGNRNYKNRGPTCLKDPVWGVSTVLEAVRATGFAPLLLCGCEDVGGCHRAHAARLFEPHFEQWVEIDYWCHPAELGKYGTVVGTPQLWRQATVPGLNSLPVQVTEPDIQRGRRLAPSWSPLSFAIARALRGTGDTVAHVAISAQTCEAFPGTSDVQFTSYPLPLAAREWQARFDAGRTVEPFAFSLPLSFSTEGGSHATS